VARRHAAAVVAEDRLIQRMRQGADERRAASRRGTVSVSSVMTAHPRDRVEIARVHGIRGASVAAYELIEPCSLPRFRSQPIQQPSDSSTPGDGGTGRSGQWPPVAYFAFSRPHALGEARYAGVIRRHLFGRSVGEIGQQAKLNADRYWRGSAARRRSSRPVTLSGRVSSVGTTTNTRSPRECVLEVEFAQDARRHRAADEVVDNRHRQLARRQQHGEGGDGPHPHDAAGACEASPRGDGAGGRGQQGDGPEVERPRVAQEEASRSFAERRTVAESALEGIAAGVEEIVTDVVCRLRNRIQRLRPSGTLHRRPRDLDLGAPRAAGEPLDRAPAGVARRELLPHVGPGRVLAEYRLDDAERFKERLPVENVQQPQTRDAVADGDLIGGLFAMNAAEQLRRRQALASEPLAQPCRRPGAGGAAVASA
jgi:hypothetical protein